MKANTTRHVVDDKVVTVSFTVFHDKSVGKSGSVSIVCSEFIVKAYSPLAKFKKFNKLWKSEWSAPETQIELICVMNFILFIRDTFWSWVRLRTSQIVGQTASLLCSYKARVDLEPAYFCRY